MKPEPRWIHERPNWPEVRWDASVLAEPLAAVRYAQGHLLGKMQGLGFSPTQDVRLDTLTHDVVKSSAIEGERLPRAEVRSSIAKKLGMNTAGRVAPKRGHTRRGTVDVDGVVEMTLDATQHYARPLTPERLFAWHAALFPTGRSGLQRITVGAWRSEAAGAMQVVSGAAGKEKVHFEAPGAARLPDEMRAFCDWFNSENGSGKPPKKLDPVLKAGIAHLWFVTIHPFEDGNGRIGRAISDMALARADHRAERFYSLSAQMEARRKGYYQQLERAQRGGLNITAWLAWFLACLHQALKQADVASDRVLFKARLWDYLRKDEKPLNARQTRVLNALLDGAVRGVLNTAKYAKITQCSKDTALRDIQALTARGVLVQNDGGGRSTSYRLVSKLPE